MSCAPDPERLPAPQASVPLVREWRDVEAGGYRLETCRFGAPDQPLRVVLLHEGLGSVAAWKEFPALLAARIAEPVLAYSRVGYGQSSPPPRAPRTIRFMHDEALDVLPALLQAFAVQQPILVGHSDGASIALIHAGIAARSGQAAGGRRSAATLGVAVLAPHLFVEPVTVEEIAKVQRGFKAADLASRLSRYHRDPAATFHSWAGVWLSTPFLDWNIEAEVAAITCPLIAIQGREDQYGTALQIERIAALRPQAKTMMLPDCRHSPHQEQPELVLAALTGFIAGLPPRMPAPD